MSDHPHKEDGEQVALQHNRNDSIVIHIHIQKCQGAKTRLLFENSKILRRSSILLDYFAQPFFVFGNGGIQGIVGTLDGPCLLEA